MRAYAKKKFGTVDIEALAESKYELRQMFEKGNSYARGVIARNKKINSESEINKKLAEKAFANEDFLSNASNTTSNNNIISDIGHKIEGTDDALIPESFNNEKIKANNTKVIDIGTIKSTPARKKRISNYNKSNEIELDNDSFEGFGYMAGILGEHHNEW